MHTLEFDQQIEQSLNQLATLSGKTADELLREITVNSIKKRARKLAISSQLPASTDSTQTEWNSFFAEFSRPIRDDAPLLREEIYLKMYDQSKCNKTI